MTAFPGMKSMQQATPLNLARACGGGAMRMWWWLLGAIAAVFVATKAATLVWMFVGGRCACGHGRVRWPGGVLRLPHLPRAVGPERAFLLAVSGLRVHVRGAARRMAGCRRRSGQRVAANPALQM
jgi:hypothetical protein